MDLRLTDKVALVTAASQGLGRACAETLAAEGMRVAVAARNARALDEVVAGFERAGVEGLALPCDIGEEGRPEWLVSETVRRFGRLDALVVSTPGPPSGSCTEITDQQFRDAMEMNCVVPMQLTRAALPHMRGQGGGRVVYIGTIGVRVAQPEMVLSNASRLALLGYAKTLALEVAADDILVNMLAPGPLATERMDELVKQTAERTGVDESTARQRWVDEVPLGRMGRAEDLSALVAMLLSDVCSYTSGAVIPVDGAKATGY